MSAIDRIREALSDCWYDESECFADLNTIAQALSEAEEALRETLDLAPVSWDGDPWYAQEEGLNAVAIIERSQGALAKLAALREEQA